MPKGVVVAVSVGIVAVIGAAILFFDEPKGPDSGEEVDISQELSGPDSGEEIDLSNEPTSPDSGEEIDPNEPTSPDSGEETTFNEHFRLSAKGSCNAIAYGSTCVEYIGAYWSFTNAKLNCSDGMYASGPCPRPTVGGCNLGSGTSNEIVTWHYDHGGDPYTTEVRPYAARSCGALPGAQWIE